MSGLGLRVEGIGSRVWGLGFRGLRVNCVGFKEFRAQRV